MVATLLLSYIHLLGHYIPRYLGIKKMLTSQTRWLLIVVSYVTLSCKFPGPGKPAVVHQQLILSFCYYTGVTCIGLQILMSITPNLSSLYMLNAINPSSYLSIRKTE